MMAKLKNAPFANKQPTGKAYEVQIIAGLMPGIKPDGKL